MTSPAAPSTLRKTALNATHRAHKAKMVDFGGWDMPVEYSGLVAEHMAVRTGVGLFDVSHMGDIQFRGPGSLAAVRAAVDERCVEACGGAGALLGDAVPGWDVCRRRGGA
jgi:glycine cleavage system aminomethyltransferase T